MKGFVFGILSGAILAALGLIGLVQYAPVIEMPAEPVVVAEEPDGEEPGPVDEDTDEAEATDEEAPPTPEAAEDESPSTAESQEPAAEAEGMAEDVQTAPDQEVPTEAGSEAGSEAGTPAPLTVEPAEEDAPADATPPAAPEEAPALQSPPVDEAADAPEPTEVPPRASALGLGAESVSLPAPPENDPPPVLQPVTPIIPDRSASAETGTPAIVANAIDFTAEGDAPILSILLRDMPASRPSAEQLSALPVPVTVALDPLADDVTEVMALYADAGIEVAVESPLPAEAQPADVEVAFEVYLSAVPRAVAVLDTEDARLQENRPRATQVVEILKATGHGLVTYEKGLNTGLQLAAQEDVAAATVFRAFDDGERDVASMKRFLDQGAFQAGLAGPVILEGDVRPETLQAITEWSLGQRAGQVTIAPLSAALLDAARP